MYLLLSNLTMYFPAYCKSTKSNPGILLRLFEAFLDGFSLVSHELECGRGFLITVAWAVQEGKVVQHASSSTTSELSQDIGPLESIPEAVHVPAVVNDGRAEGTGRIETGTSEFSNACGSNKEGEADGHRSIVASTGLRVDSRTEDSEDKEESGKEFDSENVAGCELTCRARATTWKGAARTVLHLLVEESSKTTASKLSNHVEGHLLRSERHLAS